MEELLYFIVAMIGFALFSLVTKWAPQSGVEKIRAAAVMKVANTIGPKFLAKKDKDLMARLRGILRKFSVGRFHRSSHRVHRPGPPSSSHRQYAR